MITFWDNRRHARIRALLSSYIDGEVSASEARRVEEHLAGCDECAGELESLRATTLLLGRLPSLEAPRSYALNPSDVEEAAPRRHFPSFEKFTGGLAAAGAGALVVVLLVGVVFLMRLGFTGSSGEESAAVVAQAPAPQAAVPAAPAPQAAVPAAPAPQAAVPAAPAPQAAVPAIPAAPAAPAPQSPAVPAPQTLPTAAPMIARQAAPAPAAPAPAAPAAPAPTAPPQAMSAGKGEEAPAETAELQPTAANNDNAATAEAQLEATATAEEYIEARATYEAGIAESQAVATAAAREQEKYATALAQWEQDQAERAREQAEEQRANEATYEAQLSASYAAATARADELAMVATAQVESDDFRVDGHSAPSAGAIPAWALAVVGGAALVAVASIAAGLMRRRAKTNIAEQDGNN